MSMITSKSNAWRLQFVCEYRAPALFSRESSGVRSILLFRGGPSSSVLWFGCWLMTVEVPCLSFIDSFLPYVFVGLGVEYMMKAI